MDEYNENRIRKIMLDRGIACTKLLSFALLCLCAFMLLAPAKADDAASPAGADLLTKWFAISDAAKESQPHWITPLVTVTPRLEQEYRYDQTWQARKNDVNFDNYDSGKGLEIIPTTHTEFIIGAPAYQVKTTPKGRTEGWLDETVLGKYRFVAGNEENGNYIVTGFLGYSFPTGSQAFSSNEGIVTPTIAGGKGWGTREMGFNIQSTVGVAIPTANERQIGTITTWNTGLQAHVFGKLWPEIEASRTWYRDGDHAGKNQLALTAGLVAGRFELGSRARLILGAGYQWPVSNFRIYERNVLATARVAF
jgi:hypothetical protein